MRRFLACVRIDTSDEFPVNSTDRGNFPSRRPAMEVFEAHINVAAEAARIRDSVASAPWRRAYSSAAEAAAAAAVERIALITNQAEEERTTRERVQNLPYHLQRNIFQALPVNNLPFTDDTSNKELRVMTFLKKLAPKRMGGIVQLDMPWFVTPTGGRWARFEAIAMEMHREKAYKIMEQTRQDAAAVLIPEDIGIPDLKHPIGAPGESRVDLLGELPGIL